LTTATTEWPYPAPEDDGAAAHLVPGLEMPAVALGATGSGTIDLASVPGLCVVFVYPWTGRPGVENPPGWDAIPGAHGSTPELQSARDLYPKFKASGASVFGLSGQDSSDQREFVHRQAIPFEILSDADLGFARALSLPMFVAGPTTYLKRLTLVVQRGRLIKAFYPVHPPDLHPALILAWLRSETAYSKPQK